MTPPTNHYSNHRDDHQYWEILIPYYVNRTLAPPDRITFERHLAACPACRQSLEDWHQIAGVVQQEVAVWARQTPPLSSEVRAGFLSGAASKPESAHALDAASPFHSPLRGERRTIREARRRMQVPLTLVAAAVMIAVFGALLIYMATSGDDPSSASEGETNNILPTLGLRPTDTPRPPTYTPLVNAQEAPAFAPSGDLGILGAEGDNAPVVTAPPPNLQAVVPPGIGGAGGAGDPNPTVCQASPATGASVAIYATPNGGGIAGYLAPGEWMDVFQRTVEGWHQLIWPNGYLAGWVRGSDIKLNGPCNDILYPTPTWTAAPVTPTAVFNGSIGMGYLLVTTEQIGSLPANTRVRISHAWQDSGGWWYYIVAEDETRYAEARTWQLTYAPNVTPGPTPTSKAFALSESGYSLFLTEMVGGIPANTKVTVTSGHFNGTEWVYTVIAENDAYADVKESQLVALPSTPIPPGPTTVGGATPTNVFQYLVGNGDYRFVTREQIGAIPRYTAVRIDAAWYDGVEWNYTIVSQAGVSAAARLSQIQYPPPEFFVTMTATAQFVTPSVTPTASPQLPPSQIRTFTANPTLAKAGATITLAWETINAASVSIREIRQNGTFGQWYEGLDASGTMKVRVPQNGDTQITYLLIAVDGLGREITGQITVRIE